MKGVTSVLLLLVAALALAAASAQMGSPSVGNFGPGGPHFSASNANSKSLEDKFEEALQELKVAKATAPQNRADATKASAPLAGLRETALNKSASNSTMLNSSNSSALASPNNSSVAAAASPLVNSSEDATGTATLSNGTDQQKVGASSKGSFQGFYGLTASKHEMGKSDFRSKMFLSGGFDVDKTVSFTDRGF